MYRSSQAILCGNERSASGELPNREQLATLGWK